jgi:outer membrane protein assembly factor BamB
MRRPALAAMAAILVATAVVLVVTGPNDQRLARAPEAERVPPPLVHVARGQAPSTRGAPPEVAAAAREWPLPNHDYANTRATTDSRIDSSSVARLGLAWTRPLHAGSHWGAAASAPLVADGVVYFQDLRSDLFALDLATGMPRWKRRLDEDAFGPNGPAIGYGKVYAQDGGLSLRAFDLQTGRPAWSRELAGPTGAQQPVAYDGLVYTALPSGVRLRVPRRKLRIRLVAPGSSGFLYGVRAGDGRVAWDFETVEKGFWGNQGVNSGGGVWFPPAIDTATGRTFWSTGNPAPGPGTTEFPNAASRPGPNLYTNTVLAMDGRSGRKLWHHQAKPHDLFHHDLQNPPILTRAGGRDLVIASGKGGTVFAIDRTSGRRVWTRPIGRHSGDLLRRLPADDRPVEIYPGFWGGMETPGALADGTLYFVTENLATPYTATGWKSTGGDQNVQNLEGRTPLEKGTSEVVAIDAATGRVRWTHALPMVSFGAATVVNDLVFVATYDGTVHALRRRDGADVWSFQAPAGIVAWPAVAGDTIVWPAGLGREPALFALRLGGGLPPEPHPQTSEEEPGP